MLHKYIISIVVGTNINYLLISGIIFYSGTTLHIISVVTYITITIFICMQKCIHLLNTYIEHIIMVVIRGTYGIIYLYNLEKIIRGRNTYGKSTQENNSRKKKARGISTTLCV